jgi:predicted nucleotidyltransferase component of viral defense system
MIPLQNIIAWGQTVTWTELRQVEQDLIISRALIEIFSDPFLQKELRFRGGTALNKLHFEKPLRYSEDIDLVRTSGGPMGPILDALRHILEPWMGRARYEPSPVAPKLRFLRITPEDKASPEPIRVKVEINKTEITAYDRPITIPFSIKNPWFAKGADIPTFSKEEILSTKLRALLQRDKGRDMIDLAHARSVFKDLDIDRVIVCFRKYLDAAGVAISRAQAEERMFAKYEKRGFLADVLPLLSAEERENFDRKAAAAAFRTVFLDFIARIPGLAWANAKAAAERIGMPDLARPAGKPAS